jgi:hypothetical protein
MQAAPPSAAQRWQAALTVCDVLVPCGEGTQTVAEVLHLIVRVRSRDRIQQCQSLRSFGPRSGRDEEPSLVSVTRGVISSVVTSAATYRLGLRVADTSA